MKISSRYSIKVDGKTIVSETKSPFGIRIHNIVKKMGVLSYEYVLLKDDSFFELESNIYYL